MRASAVQRQPHAAVTLGGSEELRQHVYAAAIRTVLWAADEQNLGESLAERLVACQLLRKAIGVSAVMHEEVCGTGMMHLGRGKS